MGRPQPNVLIDYTNRDFIKTEICEAENYYAVYYKGSPFNMKTTSLERETPKYCRTTFVGAGHAFALCKKLNKMFNCKDFEVFTMASSAHITEAEYYDLK